MSLAQSCQQFSLFLLTQTLQWKTFILVSVILLAISLVMRYLYSKLFHIRQSHGVKKLNLIALNYRIPTEMIIVEKSPRMYAHSTLALFPSIVLSSTLVKRASMAQLEAIILHELHHINNLHAYKQLLFRTVKRTLFFLPILHDLYLYWRAKVEVEADAYASRIQGTSTYILQSLSLLLTQSTHESNPSNSHHYAYFFNRINKLQDRMSLSTSFQTSKKHIIISCCTVLLILLFKFKEPTITHALNQQLMCLPSSCVTHCLQEPLQSREENSNLSAQKNYAKSNQTTINILE